MAAAFYGQQAFLTDGRGREGMGFVSHNDVYGATFLRGSAGAFLDHTIGTLTWGPSSGVGRYSASSPQAGKSALASRASQMGVWAVSVPRGPC